MKFKIHPEGSTRLDVNEKALNKPDGGPKKEGSFIDDLPKECSLINLKFMTSILIGAKRGKTKNSFFILTIDKFHKFSPLAKVRYDK